MPTTVAQLVADAKTHVENLNADQAAHERSNGAVLIDLREAAELTNEGMIAGAIHAPRGMVEFWADPSSPYHRHELQPTRRTILYCASGGRSALAANALTRLGYSDLAHLDGGIRAWKQAGYPVVTPAGA
jgi:rhodanese-related sulfurtransferase